MKLGPREVIMSAFLGIIVAMMIVILFPVCCKVARVEGFANSSKPIACPKNTKTFTNIHGNTMCCEGQVVGNTCEGTIRCTLSSSTDPKIPTCSSLRKSHLAEMSKQCNVPTMKQYFENATQRGCAAEVNADAESPLTDKTPFCNIYGEDKDTYYKDSCLNKAKSVGMVTVTSDLRPNFCMSVLEWNTKDNTQVGMMDCHNGDDQAFRFEKDGTLVNLFTGKCLDGHNPGNVNGGKAVEWECNGQIQQKWYYDKTTKQINHVQNPGKCLDIYGFNKNNGAILKTSDCNNGLNQKFNLVAR